MAVIRSRRVSSPRRPRRITEELTRIDGAIETSIYEVDTFGGVRLVERRITPAPGAAPKGKPSRDLNHLRSEHRR